MRSIRIPAQEQYRLIIESGQSGLTDQQWCVEHDTKPGAFYNWVKRLRQRDCSDLPPATGHSRILSEKQEVVKVNFKPPAPCSQSQRILDAASNSIVPVLDMSSMKLSVGRCILSIPNGTDPLLLLQALSIMKELGC